MPCRILSPSFPVSGTHYEYSHQPHLGSRFASKSRGNNEMRSKRKRARSRARPFQLSSVACFPKFHSVRWQRFLILMMFAFAGVANAQPEKIIKVLPHFLDAKGRASISPSLFDRDAYQQELRISTAKRSGLRFDVQWSSTYYPALVLRIEAKGGRSREPKVLEKPVKPGNFSQWTAITLSGDDYKNFGELISWRATLVNGTNIVGEQKSFLW
jgi:hypothetical protein